MRSWRIPAVVLAVLAASACTITAGVLRWEPASARYPAPRVPVAGSRAAGSRTAGRRSSGSRTAGSRTAGSRTAGSRTAGRRSAGSRTAAAGSQGPEAVDPALFSAGACIAYPPTAGDRHETVFLDAGHGGIDPGAVGSTESGATITESTINLPIELDTMALLRAQGYRVVVSRTQNTTVTRLIAGDTASGILTVHGSHNDVAARDVCANMAGASLLIGIYMNAGYAGNAGCVTGYDADRPFSAGNLRLATLLQSDVLGAMNAQGWAIPDGGVQSDTGLGSAVSAQAAAYGHLMLLGPAEAGYFTTPSQMPGALIEPLFLTDPYEGSVAASAHGQQVIASGIAQAVSQYFGA